MSGPDLAGGHPHCLPCLQAMHFLIQKSGGVICVCMEDRYLLCSPSSWLLALIAVLRYACGRFPSTFLHQPLRLALTICQMGQSRACKADST